MTPNKIQYLNADGKMTVERVRRMDGHDYITASGKIVSPTRVMGVDDSEPIRPLAKLSARELARNVATKRLIRITTGPLGLQVRRNDEWDSYLKNVPWRADAPPLFANGLYRVVVTPNGRFRFRQLCRDADSISFNTFQLFDRVRGEHIEAAGGGWCKYVVIAYGLRTKRFSLQRVKETA